jgi:hypothetical protein
MMTCLRERPGTGPIPVVDQESVEGGLLNVAGSLDRFVPGPGQLVTVVLDDALAAGDVTPGTEVLVDPAAPAVPGRPTLAKVTTPKGVTGWRAQAFDAEALSGRAVVGPIVAVRRGWVPA